MNPFYLLLVLLSVLGALWVTFRLRSDDLRGRFPAMIVGLAIAGLALYQGLQGHSPFTSHQSTAPPSRLETLSPPVTGILTEAVRFLLIILVASMGVLILSITTLAVREGIGVLRTRGPAILRYVLCVGAYLYVSLLPMGALVGPECPRDFHSIRIAGCRTHLRSNGPRLLQRRTRP